MVGKRKGFEDTRGTLFYEFARVVKESQPNVFIFENVKGLLNHDGGNTFETIKTTLGSYQLINTNFSIDVLPNRLSIFTAVTNILDKDFYENIGYSVRGRNFKLGLNFKF